MRQDQSELKKKLQRNYCYYSVIKGKVQPQNKLISDARSDKIGDVRLSISLLVPKIFVFKVEKLLIYLVSYQNKGDCDLNQSNVNSFVERMAKNNRGNNGDRHTIFIISLLNGRYR